MTTPQPTRDDLNYIRAELLSIEREMHSSESSEQLFARLTRSVCSQAAEIEFLRNDNQDLCAELNREQKQRQRAEKFMRWRVTVFVIFGVFIIWWPVLKIAGVL